MAILEPLHSLVQSLEPVESIMYDALVYTRATA